MRWPGSVATPPLTARIYCSTSSLSQITLFSRFTTAPKLIAVSRRNCLSSVRLLAHVNADDLARARRFYETVFGWRFRPWGLRTTS